MLKRSYQHPEFRRPERLLQRHLQLSRLLPLVENPLASAGSSCPPKAKSPWVLHSGLAEASEPISTVSPTVIRACMIFLLQSGGAWSAIGESPNVNRHLDFSAQALFIKFKRLFASPIEHQIRRYLCLTRGKRVFVSFRLDSFSSSL